MIFPNLRLDFAKRHKRYDAGNFLPWKIIRPCLHCSEIKCIDIFFIVSETNTQLAFYVFTPFFSFTFLRPIFSLSFLRYSGFDFHFVFVLSITTARIMVYFEPLLCDGNSYCEMRWKKSDIYFVPKFFKYLISYPPFDICKINIFMLPD
mgnify:CR=1 FL=1